jgi:hypothetical protein
VFFHSRKTPLPHFSARFISLPTAKLILGSDATIDFTLILGKEA